MIRLNLNISESKNDIIASCNRAILKVISNKLRGVTIQYKSNELIWKAYFNGEPEEEEIEALSVACTEVIADFPEIKRVTEEYLCVKYPEKIEKLDEWIFREVESWIYKIENFEMDLER